MAIDRYKNKIRKESEGRGMHVPGSWKEDSDKLFSPEKVRELYREMKSSGFVPDDTKDFVFVSPSANIPTHERTFFEEDQRTRKGHGTFLVGDIGNFNVAKSDISRAPERGNFQYFRWDAEHLPIKKESVDMIWDRKGWLWHCVYEPDVNRFLDTINQYEELLKDGGCIVVDSIEWMGIESTPHKREIPNIIRIWLLAATKIKQARPTDYIRDADAKEYEESTTTLMREVIPNIEDLLKKDFELFTLGSGSGRVLVMRKRLENGRARDVT